MRELILATDASDTAIGAELIQVQNGEERVIAYSHFALTPYQRKYCTTRKESLSIVRFTRHFWNYLLGKIFKVRRDHSSLTWLLKFKDPQGQLACWMEELSQHNMVVQHRPGTKHGHADALSRKPDSLTPCTSYLAGIKPADLLCGGCHYCVRADQQWGNFTRDEGEAVSLTNSSSSTIANNTVDNQGSEFVLSTCNPSDKTVRSENRNEGLRCQNPENSGSDIPFDPEQNCIQANADSQDNIDMLEDFGEINSIGLSEAHFDIVRIGKEAINICVGTITVAQEATSEQSSCWGFTFEDVKREQGKDKDLKIIIQWLTTQLVPNEGSLFISSPGAKYYLLNKEMFQLVDGVLFRQKTDSKDLELVVPDSL